MVFGTLKGLEQSMNPQLIKYSRETDISIAQSRKESRRRLFGSYQTPTKATPTENVEPYREQFGQRIFLKCDSLQFRLLAPMETEKDPLCQIEPYFTSLALYDAKAGRKLTENFYFDLNTETARKLIQTDCCKAKKSENGTTNGIGNGNHKLIDSTLENFDNLPKNWIMYPRQAILSVAASHPDVFLVVKIDKILQGGINQSSEPYLKPCKDPKLGLKLHKSIRAYNQRIGHYRMPFAWAARPLFRLYSSDLDTAIQFPAIYRQEGNKLKDEELLKLLAEYRKPEKFSKLTVIPGILKISIDAMTDLPKSMFSNV